MRTDIEIVERIQQLQNRDFFGFETGDLVCRLPYESAKEFLKPEVTKEEWDKDILPRDRESVLKEMQEYMPFAWEKANDGLGISASRSMSHYSAWIWLLGDDLGDLSGYQYYGKDNLVRICNHYGWDSKQWDDGERTNG